MNSINRISPLLTPGYGILGIICIISGLTILLLNIFYSKTNLDLAFLILCIGLFCTGYRKERNESDENSEIFVRRYHALRLALSLTTIIVITVSSSFIFSDNTIKFNALHSLLIYLAMFNCISLIIKFIQKRKNK